MNNILTPEQIKQYKDIGYKVDDKKIIPIIEQAQIVELKEVLGDRFYFDVLANINNAEYSELFNGSSFTYYDVTYYQDGLNALLADYFMSKYILQVNTNLTPFGATQKASNDSEPTDRNTLKDVSTQQLQLAGARWEIIKMYLDVHLTKFPNWKFNINGEVNSEPYKTLKFRKI